MVPRPSSLPLASSTTATTVPLSTLAVPETSTGELMGLLPSGLSMMMRSPPAMGVAEAAGCADVFEVSELVAVGETVAEAVGEPGVLPPWTKVVMLSPPQALKPNATSASRIARPLFVTALDRQTAYTLTSTPVDTLCRSRFLPINMGVIRGLRRS